MTDYTVDADWSGKDTLTSSNPLKVVKGSEFQIEFDAISTAIATKFDSSSAVDINSGAIDNTTIGATTAASGTFTNLTATTSTLTSPVINTGVSGTAILDDDTFATASATTLATSESIKAYVDNSAGIDGITSTATSEKLILSDSELISKNNLNIVSPGSGIELHSGTSTDSSPEGEFGLSGGQTFLRAGGPLNAAQIILDPASGGTTTFQTDVTFDTDVTVNGLTLGRGLGQDSSSVAFGDSALGSSTTGEKNTAVGQSAGEKVLTGSYNTAVGYNTLGAGANLLTGNGNVAIGAGANQDLEGTANGNTAVGYFAGSSNTTGANNTNIGNSADSSSITVSNQITLGDSNITSLRCNVTSITSLSDMRDKTNIADLSGASNFIKNLEPVSFDWARRDNTLQGVQSHGFLAQQLQSAQDSTGYQVPGLVFDDNPDKLEASYGNLLPTVVAALKDALTEIDELKAKVAALESA